MNFLNIWNKWPLLKYSIYSLCDLIISVKNISISDLAKSYLPDRVHDAVPRDFGKINPSRCAEPVSVQFICMGIAPHGDGCTLVSILSGPPVPSASCLVFSWTEATRSRASATAETSSIDFTKAPNSRFDQEHYCSLYFFRESRNNDCTWSACIKKIFI